MKLIIIMKKIAITKMHITMIYKLNNIKEITKMNN